MKRRLVLALATVFAALSACGGGGGDGGTPVTQPFALRQAWINDITNAQASPFTLSGTMYGYAITGSGTLASQAPFATTFESRSAMAQVQAINGTVTVAGQTAPLSQLQTLYFDSNYTPLGAVDDSSYSVVVGTPVIPQTAYVGDTGTLYTTNVYDSSAKTSLLGTSTATFALRSDSATTALLVITSTSSPTGGGPGSTTVQNFRVTTAGTLTRLSETEQSGGDTLTLTYR